MLGLKDLFMPRAPVVIGLDLDNVAVRMVELSKSGRGLRLERYAIERLPAGAVEDGLVLEPSLVNQAVQTCRQKLHSRIKHAAAALPSSSIVTKRLRVLDNMQEEELAAQVLQEANNSISIPMDQAALDYQIVSRLPSSSAEPGDLEVLVAACQKEKVEERVAIVEAGGFKAAIVDSDLLALLDAADQALRRPEAKSGGKPTLLIDIGPSLTRFHFCQGGAAIHTRDHSFGIVNLLQDISQAYEVDEGEAEQIRAGLRAVDTSMLMAAKERFVEATTQEAQRAVQLLLTSTNFGAIEAVAVLGVGVGIPMMASSIQKALDVPTQVLNPFIGMEVAHRVDRMALAVDAPSLAVACGLALRSFDR